MKLFNWFARAGPAEDEARSLENPSTSLSDPAAWLLDAFTGSKKSVTGVPVTPENALELTSVWAAVNMIARTLATLPLPVYERVAGGKEKAPTHPAYRLLHDRPNPEMSAFTFRETLAAHLLLYGNAYAEIERNGKGEPVGLWPIHPTAVRVTRINGAKVYVVRVDGQEIPLSADNVLHFPGFSLDGHNGLFPVKVTRNAIALGKATEEFGSAFFGNGAAPSGVLTHPAKLGKEGHDLLRESWNASYSGLSNAHRIAILEEGMEWHPLGVPPEHAQFLETRKFSVAEVSRIFLIPPHFLADLENAHFSNIEAQGIHFVQYCIEPWCKRIEQELNFKLFGDYRHFAEFSLEGLLRGDSAARASFYREMWSLGVYSINEIRERENLNRIEGGDVRYIPLNMAPLGSEQAGKVVEDAV
jgi:HK97 family phage portal protein